MKENISFRDRIQYKIDNFMAKGGLSIFLALLSLFAFAFFVMATIRLATNFIVADSFDSALKNIGEQFWRVLLQISDIGAMQEDQNADFRNKLLGVITSLIGLFLFSSLLAFITSSFKEKVESLRKGKSAIIEEGHTLMLGFGHRSLEIIRELIIANESEKDAAIVVLSETEKEEMDDFFKERIAKQKTTRIITRSGSTSNLYSLKRMRVQEASSIIILNTAQNGDPEQVKDLGDAKALKSIMAVIAAVGEKDPPQIVVELFSERNRTLAEEISPGNVVTLDEDTILAKILVQTSRNHGLSLIYSNIVGFEGNEIYFYPRKKGWNKLNFEQLQFHFKHSIPLGVRTKDHQILINPDKGYCLADDDELIIMAEDDSTIHFHEKPIIKAKDVNYSSKKRDVTVEKQLIIGWSKKSPTVLNEYASYLRSDSTIDVYVSAITEEIQTVFDDLKEKYPEIQLSLGVKNIYAHDALTEIQPENYNNVVILAPEGSNAEEIDALTISLLLQFRQYFRHYALDHGHEPETKLITEVMDSENTDVILKTGVKDFLISNQFVSKIFAQVSQEADVKLVYDDLFQEDGSEIYLKSADLFFAEPFNKFTFTEIMKAALHRNEICFGVKIAAEEKDPTKNYGVYLLPQKSKIFDFKEGDCLVTVAEDET